MFSLEVVTVLVPIEVAIGEVAVQECHLWVCVKDMMVLEYLVKTTGY